MNKKIKEILEHFVPQVIHNRLRRQSGERQLVEWKKQGCPVPPPHIVKQITIQKYQQKYGNETLVETGTYFGDMVEAQKAKFKKIVSIELGVHLFEKAQRRFRKDKNVTIVHGDSGKVLHELVDKILEPAIFWLDGHFSAGITAKGDKECPIFEELDAILHNKSFHHVILIDDARCFVGQGDYPTIDELKGYIKTKNEKYFLEVKHDIIRCDWLHPEF